MSISKEDVANAFEEGRIVDDGHTIYAPFLYEGFEVDHLIGTHYSDRSSYKSTLTDNAGNVIDSVEGINNLAFLFWLADEVGIEFRTMHGRGSQAQEIVEQLKKWIESE